MLAGNLGPRNHGSRKSTAEADYWVAAPILSNGWTILGEAEALVPVSPQRLVSFDISNRGNSTDLSMVVVGSEGEAVTMLVADPAQAVYKLPCVLKGSGKAEVGVTTTALGRTIRCVEL